MKKPVLYLFLLFCFLVSTAQIYNEDFSRQQKINIFKENKVWMVYGWTFLYPKGKQEKKGKKSSFERFDHNGNRTEEMYYDRDGKPNYACEFLYDEKGNQVKRMGNSGDEAIYEKWNYSSTENGKKLERKSEYKKSKDERWTYTFNAEENIAEEVYYDINGIMSSKCGYVYDDKMNLAEKTEYDAYGNVYKKWTYKYDDKGNNIEMQYSLANNRLQGSSQMHYDKKGNMKSKFNFDKNENIIDLTVYIYQFYDGLHSARGTGNKEY